MAKVKTKWVCQNCGYETVSYLGRCPDCSQFGTFVEETTQVVATDSSKLANQISNDSKVSLIKEIEFDEKIRFKTNIEELNRVLGGGFVQGSLSLLAGDPGIGKSTLVLQTTKSICDIKINNQNLKVLYVCAEESPLQVKLRAKRLGVEPDNLYLTNQTCINELINQIDVIKPNFLIVDSIQSVFCANVSSSTGSVSQIRECTNALMQIAKQKNITTIVIGHVTKEGNIAGPKVLEHMVDCVINFEGDKYKQYRILRCIKNRFGAISEVGVFKMEDDGLNEVSSPSQMLMEQHQGAFGSAVVATLEGSRIFLHEIQALVGSTNYANPRRVAVGIEYNRLLQILAVLEKKVGLNLSKQDVYVNVVGGIDIVEPSYDLALALAIISSIREIPIRPDTILIGEVGLLGEIRYVENIERRLKEAQKLGFKRAIVPKMNDKTSAKLLNVGLEIKQVSKLTDAIIQGLKQD
ncbi:MAG: DNA repair protein RadA [Candidatus Gastranaerophilales bacterium]|nr:DNA repair protein RadA [Candidatus Gastranaerophilales bacterium]